MGNFDDREQKDAAVKMVGELDAEIVVLKAERDEAVAQRDASRAVNAELLAARHPDALAEHDRAVRAEALEEFADIVHRDLRIRPDDRPVGWANRMRAQAAEIRKAT